MKRSLTLFTLLLSVPVYASVCSNLDGVYSKLNISEKDRLFKTENDDNCILFYDGNSKNECHGCPGELKVAHVKAGTVTFNEKVLDIGSWGKVGVGAKFEKISSEQTALLYSSGFTMGGHCESNFTMYIFSSDYKTAKEALIKRVNGCDESTGFKFEIQKSSGVFKDLLLESYQQSYWNQEGYETKELYQHDEGKYVKKRVLFKKNIEPLKIKVDNREYTAKHIEDKIIFEAFNDSFYVTKECLVKRGGDIIGAFWGSASAGGGITFRGKEIELEGDWSIFDCNQSAQYEKAMRLISN